MMKSDDVQLTGPQADLSPGRWRGCPASAAPIPKFRGNENLTWSTILVANVPMSGNSGRTARQANEKAG
jgi:hypothetical protein